MAFLTQRIIQSALKLPATIRASQVRLEPDVVVLPVRDGVPPSDKPPVRIYLGTETAQYKAERIFVWSIERVRDPSRVYEIYLMKHLYGFRSRFWLTGFTNYRFAIPHFAGKCGRAIYNDVDQVYLKDPAELFDLDMGDHGYLAIDPGDISVALFDCAQMARVWSLVDAQKGRKNELLARASSSNGLWGKLDGSWNARDREYLEGESGVLHFTALHKQPWHPFPKLFVYQPNQVANVWYGLEQSANEAGFQVFSKNSPSRSFRDFAQLTHDARKLSHDGDQPVRSIPAADETGLADLLDECDARSVLDCRLEAVSPNAMVRIPGSARAGIEQLTKFDPTEILENAGKTPGAHIVVCLEMLDYVPDDDVPWLLKYLFGLAERCLYCEVAGKTPIRHLQHNSMLSRHQRTIEWWQYQFQLVARHYPKVRWRLRVKQDNRPAIIEGNEYGRPEAMTWVIANRKPGHNGQAIALAEMVGWPFEVMRVPQVLKSLLLVLLHAGFGTVKPLREPWPSFVVACGWWPTRVARWIQMRSGGRVRLLLAGRKCGPVKNPTDVLISCKHFNLPIHERRIETLLPAHTITASKLDAARKRGLQLMGDAPKPRVALLVGGSAKQHVLTENDARRMGERVLEQVQAIGGSLFAVTSRRTGARQAAALAKSLRDKAHLHVWSHDEVDNPYLAYVTAADILIVTGESESMLMDALAADKPVYIYPIRQRHYGPWLTLGAKLVEWSHRRPKNRRGTERPQQGLEYLCSRILKREWILPPRDLDGLHQRLVKEGMAKMFGQAWTTEYTARHTEADDLGHRLRIMLAQPLGDPEAKSSDTFSHNATIET